MIGTTYGIKAYQQALGRRQSIEGQVAKSMDTKPQDQGSGFLDAMSKSLQEVNAMESEKSGLIEAFAAGKSENVHELMISLQKAGVAMSMTSAVRNKVLSAYQELMRLSF